MIPRVGAIARESRLNLGFHSLVVLVLSLISCITLARLEVSTVTGLLSDVERFQEAGGFIMVAESEAGRLPGYRCGALATQPGVLRVGAVRRDAPEWESQQSSSKEAAVAALQAPGIPFGLLTASPGMVPLWNPSVEMPTGPGVVLGEAAAIELGLGVGDVLVPERGEAVPVVAVLDTELRNPSAMRKIIALTPPMAAVHECWVEFTPEAFNAAETVMNAVFSQEIATAVQIVPFRRPDELGASPSEKLLGRPHRNGWIGVALTMTASYWLTSWSRRSEWGLYRALGFRIHHLLLMAQLEVALLATAAFLGGVSWALASEVATGSLIQIEHVMLAVRSVWLCCALFGLLSPGAVAAVGARSAAHLLKDR
ncbi:MAG: hypothetical protein ACRDVM_00615 [Acidimicrobiia bacterium]